MSVPESSKPMQLNYHQYVPENYEPKLVPIIFIHGVSCTQATWYRVKSIIAEKTKRKVYAVDIRNHGRSGWTEDFNLDVLVEDIVHFMDEKDIQQSILVGHSIGGTIAACVAALEPSRIEKLIIEDQKLTFSKEESANLLKALKAVMKTCLLPKSYTEKQAKEFLRKIITSYFPENINFQDFPIYKDKNGEFKMTFYVEPMIKSLEDGVLLFPDFEKYKKYVGPTLFVYGGKSIMLVYEDEQITKIFPNAQLIKIENGYHMLHEEVPDKFTEIVSDFINN